MNKAFVNPGCTTTGEEYLNMHSASDQGDKKRYVMELREPVADRKPTMTPSESKARGEEIFDRFYAK
jgi:hypothetical protein